MDNESPTPVSAATISWEKVVSELEQAAKTGHLGKQEASDVVNHVLLKMFVKNDQKKFGPGLTLEELESLKRKVRNRAGDEGKKHVRQDALLHELMRARPERVQTDPREEVESRDDVEQVFRIVKSLAFHDRTVFYGWRDGWSSEEIALELNVSASAVQKRLRKILRILRSALTAGG